MTDAVGRLASVPPLSPRFDSRWIMIGVPVALVVWLALVPLVFLLWQSFLTPQTAAAPAQYTLDNFRTAYFAPETALAGHLLSPPRSSAQHRREGRDWTFGP